MRPVHRYAAGRSGLTGNAETDGRSHATRVPTVFENVQRNLSGDRQSALTRGLPSALQPFAVIDVGISFAEA